METLNTILFYVLLVCVYIMLYLIIDLPQRSLELRKIEKKKKKDE